MALIDPKFDQFFLGSLRALGGYLEDVVLVGGCANALYRYVPDAVSHSIRPMLTYDIDFAASSSLRRREAPLAALLMQAGLVPDREGRPTNKYQPVSGSDSNETIEFLCPMTGLSTAVKEQRPTLVSLPADATAEALDYLDLLLLSPLHINLRDVPPLDVREDLVVQIPNPVSYVMQKVLIRSRRVGHQKQAKDSYYIYEVSLLFRTPGSIHRIAEGVRSGRFPAKWGKEFFKQAAILYGHENAEGVQEAVAVAQANGTPVDAAMVFRVVEKMLAEIRSGLGLASNDGRG